MRPLAITSLVLGIVLGVTFLLPLPSAQSTETGDGVLFLLPQKMRTTSTPTQCGTTPVFNMTSDYPGIRNGTKAYLGRSLAGNCGTTWEFVSTSNFTTSGNFSILLHLGCDSGIPVMQTGAVAATIRKNTTDLGKASWNAPSSTCPSAPWKVNLKIPTKGTAFTTGDKLSLVVALNAISTEESASKMAHVRVGNGTYNSSISAPGLPMGIPQPTKGDLSQDTNSPTTAAPPTSASATASASASASASSTTGTSRPNTTAPTTRGGTNGTSSTAGATGGANETASANTTTDSTAGADGGGSFGGGDAGSEKDISGQADAPGPGVLVVAAMIAGVAYLARRRVEKQ